MLLKVGCGCGHMGAVSDHHLPRELQCSACGSRRRVETDHGRPIYSQARFEEWIAGTRERPQARHGRQRP
jgi:hypothetical protein